MIGVQLICYISGQIIKVKFIHSGYEKSNFYRDNNFVCCCLQKNKILTRRAHRCEITYTVFIKDFANRILEISDVSLDAPLD